MTVHVVDLESIETRYTCEWKTHIPELLNNHGLHVNVISGPAVLPKNPESGTFLNFAATNIYKAKQIELMSKMFVDNKVKDGDYFLFTDAWHPGIINLKYMASLLCYDIKIGGLFHAGSWDKYDILGQVIKDAPWCGHAESAMFHALDHCFFATQFHIDMFCQYILYNQDYHSYIKNGKIVKTGWPMEYMKTTLARYSDIKKENLILFPHRLSSEKQLDIFLDLKKAMPEFQFVVCQEQTLTKKEYHTLLAKSKIVFSASLQETLGISVASEAPLLNSVPVAPNRLSYKEIFAGYKGFLYPSEWTESYQAYLANKESLILKLKEVITHYPLYLASISRYLSHTHNDYFTADTLIKVIQGTQE